jgi:hypothetical protein
MVHEIDVVNNIDVIREMNDAEYEQHLIDKANFETEQSVINAAAATKAAAKAELLAALNLSQETLDLLNGLN